MVAQVVVVQVEAPHRVAGLVQCRRQEHVLQRRLLVLVLVAPVLILGQKFVILRAVAEEQILRVVRTYVLIMAVNLFQEVSGR